jgi:hypothetical protein
MRATSRDVEKSERRFDGEWKTGFVFDLPEGFTMRGAVNRLGRLGFRHAIQVQRLARNCAVFFDDRSREFMSEAGAVVRDLLVLTSQCATGFGLGCASLLPARKSPPGAIDLAFGFPERSRFFVAAAI